MIDLIKSSLIISMSLALLWHFSNIVRYGTHIIQEPSPVILWSEVGLLAVILVFGIWSVVKILIKIGRME